MALDSTAIVLALIASAPPTIVALAAFVKSSQAVTVGKEAKSAVQEVHVSINSRLTQLLEATAAASKAEGVAQERAETISKFTT